MISRSVQYGAPGYEAKIIMGFGTPGRHVQILFSKGSACEKG
jgi:hypothetical protein